MGAPPLSTVVEDFSGEFSAGLACGELQPAAAEQSAFRQRAWLKRRHGAKMEWRPRKRHRMVPFKWDKIASILAVFGAPSISAKYQSVPTNIRRPDEVHSQTSTREIHGLFDNRNIRTHSTLQPCWTMNGPRSLRHTSDRTCNDRKRILSNMLPP